MAETVPGTTEENKNAYAPELLDVQGFRFLTRQDAEKAEIDAGKIAYIESHVGGNAASAMLAVYEKSIQNKIFGTPVGWCFLHGLRDKLIGMGVDEAALRPIPMTTGFTRPVTNATPMPEAVQEAPKKKRREKEKEPKKNTPALVLSVVVNLVLIGLVIAMFMVLNYGETVNMLNYKQQYTNEYAIMKQELQQEIQDRKKELLERERAVSERERALGMENTSSQTNETGGSEND